MFIRAASSHWQPCSSAACWRAIARPSADNTRLVKGDDIPKNYEDLLLRKWKGKLGLDLNNKTEWYVVGAEDYNR